MALFTLEEYRTFADLNGTKQDAQITSLLPAVQAVVEGYIGYKLGADGQTQRFLTQPDRVSYPLDSSNLSVTSVVYQNTGPEATAARTLPEAEYFISDLGILTLLNPNSIAGGTEGERNALRDNGILTVVFDQDTDTIPEDLKLAGMHLLRHYLKNEVGRETVSIAGQSVSYMAADGFPGYIRGMLDLHRLL